MITVVLSDIIFFYQEADGDPNEGILQIMDFNYNNTNKVALATLDKNAYVPSGLKLQTSGGTYMFEFKS